METGLTLSREALIQLLLVGLRGANVIYALKKMGAPIELFEMRLLSEADISSELISIVLEAVDRYLEDKTPADFEKV